MEQSKNVNSILHYLNITELKLLKKEELLKYDVLNALLRQLFWTSRSYVLSTDPLNYFHFNEDSSYYHRNPEEKTLFLKMLEYICSTVPELITEKMIKELSYYRANDIVNILANYYTDEKGECCFICFSSHASNLIDNTCACKNKIHLECLISTTKKLGNICQTCLTSNGAVIDPNNRIIFPFQNIYQIPLMNRYEIINDLNTQLHYAIAYLQYDRVKDILSKISKEQYQHYYQTADYYALHRKNEDGSLKLLNMPYSNLSRNNNKEAFDNIERLLKEVHVK